METCAFLWIILSVFVKRAALAFLEETIAQVKAAWGILVGF
jgi:hypothetical protein